MEQDTMSDSRLLRQVKLDNFLSFGPDTPALELKSLNVFIGPNGAGKSNLIEALALMRATPGDVRSVIRHGGGVAEWLWKGAKDPVASVEFVVNNPKGLQALRHVVSFRGGEQGFRLHDERIENEARQPGKPDVYFYYRFQHGHPVINAAGEEKRALSRESINPELSVLAQRRDPDLYPEITYLADTYDQCRIYREWSFGRNTVFREPQKADMRSDRLEEDFSNLGLYLSQLGRSPLAKEFLVLRLQDLYDGLTTFEVVVQGGSVQVFLIETGASIPATRLSDGTLRYLCLLAMLGNPKPPPLICIEEPELGLHPDLLPKIADLLVEASSRTQIIVTTHSDILVDAMTERPESVVVFEKHDGRTEMKRLEQAELSAWLVNYRLGQLWTKGQLGGTRW